MTEHPELEDDDAVEHSSQSFHMTIGPGGVSRTVGMTETFSDGSTRHVDYEDVVVKNDPYVRLRQRIAGEEPPSEVRPARAARYVHGHRKLRGDSGLIGELPHAALNGRLEPALEPYLQPHVLVIDELGYLSHAADAANVLYRVVNERYLKGRSILLTTNKPLAALGTVLHDGDLAEAILDRLLERGVHFAMRGRSYRTRHLNEEEQPSRRAKSA